MSFSDRTTIGFTFLIFYVETSLKSYNMKTKIYFSFFILLLASAGSCTKDDGFDTSEEGSTVPTGTAVSITGSVTFGTKEGSQETGANEDDLLTRSEERRVGKECR